MTVKAHDLWSLVLDQSHVDPAELAEAIEDQVDRGDLDFRSRLLIRDSLNALLAYWGNARMEEWLRTADHRTRIEAIWREELGKAGFPFLKEQVMDPTRPETIRQLLRDVGARIRRPVKTFMGGSGACILKGYLNRKTQDLDFVDEGPAEDRALGTELHELERQYRLELAHFQRHYLPMRWENRIHSQEPFGRLQVYLVDVHDVFLSKLSSIREKDKDDLRTLAPQLDKETLARMLKDDCASMLAAPDLRERCKANWYILYGEELPA